MEKRATSLLRALSRAGALNNGVAGRLLKRLTRRGLNGFSPETVDMLRARGMLPTNESVLGGFERGTQHLLSTHPQKLLPGGPYHAPFKVNRIGYDDPAFVSFRKGEINIPDTPADFPYHAGIDQLTTRRHEAREYVRGLKAISRGRTTAFLGPWSCHMPGVMHDERVYTNALLNRLGRGYGWRQYNTEGKTFRTPREFFVGDKPLSYEMGAYSDYLRDRAAALRARGVLGALRHPRRTLDLLYGIHVPTFSARVKEIMGKANESVGSQLREGIQ